MEGLMKGKAEVIMSKIREKKENERWTERYKWHNVNKKMKGQVKYEWHLARNKRKRKEKRKWKSEGKIMVTHSTYLWNKIKTIG